MALPAIPLILLLALWLNLRSSETVSTTQPQPHATIPKPSAGVPEPTTSSNASSLAMPRSTRVSPFEISPGIMASHLVSAPPPNYPVLARIARVKGQVALQAVISQDGSVVATHVLSGHRLLPRRGHRRRPALALSPVHRRWPPSQSGHHRQRGFSPKPLSQNLPSLRPLSLPVPFHTPPPTVVILGRFWLRISVFRFRLSCISSLSGLVSLLAVILSASFEREGPRESPELQNRSNPSHTNSFRLLSLPLPLR